MPMTMAHSTPVLCPADAPNPGPNLALALALALTLTLVLNLTLALTLAPGPRSNTPPHSPSPLLPLHLPSLDLMDSMFCDELALPLDCLASADWAAGLDWLSGEDLLEKLLPTAGGADEQWMNPAEEPAALPAFPCAAQGPILLRPLTAKGPGSRFRCTGAKSAKPTAPEGNLPRLATLSAPCRLDVPSLPSFAAVLPQLAQPQLAPSCTPSPNSSATKLIDGDSDSDDSNDTEEDAGAATSVKYNKRKAPDVDWRSITDPAERRRQRRLAKNRMTAARSRERKKEQWSDMEAKLNGLEAQNQQLRSLLEAMTRENGALREQLGQLVSSEAGATTSSTLPASKGGRTGESAVLVFIATLLLLCAILPGEQAVLALGGALPLLMTAIWLQLQAASSHTSGSKPQHSSSLQPATKRSRTGLARQSLAYPPSASLLHFLVSVKLLLAHSSRPLAKAAQRLLFSHHLFSPPHLRKAMVPMSFAGLPLRSYVLAL
ncbi:hypothetical protein QJQ45_028668 [Haematococcus lacustris]|nr:hypothetical protein QJQ45_028668 [Haematococcus lacustris]